MSKGSPLTAKWHADRWGKPQENAEKKDHSIRERFKALHEDAYGKTITTEEKPQRIRN